MQSKPVWVGDLKTSPKNQDRDVLGLKFAILYFYHARLVRFKKLLCTKSTKAAENVYVFLVVVSIGTWHRTHAGKRVHHN